MSEIESSAFDIQRLRRGLRDLAALSALPIVWTESDPRRFAEYLADALLHMLHLELVYVLVRDRGYEIPIEVVHTDQGPAATAQAQEIGRSLDTRLKNCDLSTTPSTIANPLGGGMTRIIRLPFGIEARGGTLVACSPREDFPTEVERLLLGVAANQVAMLLDRRRAEDALRDSEQRFRGTFENAGVGIADLDVQGRFVRVNQKLCEIVGYPRDELLQKTWQDITHPDDLDTSLEKFLPFLRGELAGYSLEKRYVRKDGAVAWADVAVSVGRDPAGMRTSIIAVLQDISQRKRLEEELSQTHARLELAVRGSNITILELIMPDGILENSRSEFISAGNQLSGHDRSELPSDFATIIALMHPDDRERVIGALRAHLSGQTSECEAEYRVRHKDGLYRWRLARGVAVRDAQGNAIRCMISIVDITELKRAEEALRESEQRFRTFVDHASDAFFLHDDRLVVVDVNRQACLSLGYTRDELVGMTPLDFDPDVTPAMIEEFRRKLDAGRILKFESRHRRKDGSVFPVEVRGRPFSEGGRWFTVSLARDITDRKRVEEVLRESERRFRTLAEALPHMVWTAEPDGSHDYFNARNTEYTGLTHEQLRGWDWEPTVHPEDLPRCLELWKRSIATGELYEIEYRLRRFDGVFRWHLARALALRDDSGRITKWFGSCIDIDAQKRAEEALRESEAWFRFMANSMPQIVWTARADGSPEYLNDRYVEYTGLTVAEGTGERWLSVIHPDDRERTMTTWMADVASGSEHDAEWRLQATDGRYRWFKSRGLPVRDGSGQIVKWLGTITDIDDQKRTEEVLRRAKEAAEAASRAKDDFLANVSHEIRTPMNAILGMTELALDTPLTEEQREYLAIVKSSADALLKVINDLLDFSKIEAGKLELDHAEFSLRHVLGETLRTLALRAHRKGLELACRIQPEVPDALLGDPGRLRQILLNLVGNAIKFTEQGEVVVGVEAGAVQTSKQPDLSVPGSQQSQVLHFSINDTGIGIPREKQERIFQAFEQGDNSTTRRYEGTGLGLPIAVRLAALMGGEITVQSEPVRGSTFRFTAEFGLQPHPTSGPHERPLVDLHGLRVLIVDDNATNRQILEEWLQGWRTEPLAVPDGFKALEALWRAVAIGRPFALVLLDVRMPGTDGLAVAESIKGNPELAAARIILLTSEDQYGDIARYRELGIAAYATKPVPQEELLEIIYRVLSRPDSTDLAQDRVNSFETASVSTTAIQTASTRRLRILVAEDNPFNQRLVAHLLSRKGHEVRLASDGLEALAALEKESFDLMALDVHMPKCDGFQVIEALRRREQAEGGHLPVLALTARAGKIDRERCLAAGMDDYLAKPVGAGELFAAIERLLSPDGVPQPIQSQAAEDTGLVNSSVLLAACGDDADGLRRICDGFRDYVPGQLAEVGDALREQNAPRLREAAHRLCGLLSTLSTEAGSLGSKIEDQAACGRLEECHRLVEQLEAIVQELLDEVDGLSIETLRHQALSASEADQGVAP